MFYCLRHTEEQDSDLPQDQPLSHVQRLELGKGHLPSTTATAGIKLKLRTRNENDEKLAKLFPDLSPLAQWLCRGMRPVRVPHPPSSLSAGVSAVCRPCFIKCLCRPGALGGRKLFAAVAPAGGAAAKPIMDASDPRGCRVGTSVQQSSEAS